MILTLITKRKPMKKKNTFYLIATTFILMGCVKQSDAQPTNSLQKSSQIPIKQAPKVGMKLSELKPAESLSSIALKTKKSYALNESIQFMVDTGDAEGYLYIIYLSNRGETGLLYPNANAPLSEMGGSFSFPQDFGNMNIRATKDCKGCREEQTTIYAILSKKPIVDIQNIKKQDLLRFTQPKANNRAIKLELGNNTKRTSDLHVGKVNFFVQ